MRIQIDFDKKNRSKSIIALERFLNCNLIQFDHGRTFDAIFITLIEEPKKKQTYKRRFLYKEYADIAIPCSFDNYAELNIENFTTAFEAVKNSINFIKEIPIEKTDFNESLLKKDLDNLCQRLPKTMIELNKWAYDDQIDKEIHLKRMICRTNQRRKISNPLVRKVNGVRMYDKKRDLLLRPYLNIFSELLSKEFKSQKLLSPRYSEIYFSISDTIDDAKTEFPLENWHEYTYVSLDYEAFSKLSEEDKFGLLLKSISVGLMEIAEIDQLDKAAINLCLEALNREVSAIFGGNADKTVNLLKLNSKNQKILLNRR